ncbi:hypothetical protein CSAL01_01481 [Colletotrichum salicis]|uniref:Uncharacterized protein n=1 Tax=Colletotrichum salicis TaxID=1209931 RepID=A0A135V8P9_9PEZI|nr:hypothetical protein CSAL01_01481 [Colletotrichum salicis]
MFALRPSPGGLGLNEPPGFHDSPSPTTIKATISSIEWSEEAKTVCEARLQEMRSIRLRGNVPLAFDSDVRFDPSIYMGMYIFERPSHDGLKPGVEVTYKTFPGYGFLPRKGYLTTVNGLTNAFRVNRRIQIHGTDDDPQWELMIHELDAEVLASYVTGTSMVRAEHKFTKEAILISKLWVNKVWSLDHCFNALAIAALDQQLGLDQLTVIFDHQAPDGRLTDSVDWQNIEWGFTKPPI